MRARHQRGRRLRFDGWIAGVGTASGTRLVVGYWPGSPWGPFADVMVEHPDGHRELLAPTPEVADFVAATYSFDAVTHCPVTVVPGAAAWRVTAGPLRMSVTPGRRDLLGRVLRAVPRRVAVQPAWAAVCDLPARWLMPGVRTRGSAGGGRREWYAALDHHLVTAVDATWDGTDLGPLRAVHPPVRFGFGSAPRAPSLTRVVSTVELPPTQNLNRTT
ncbi:hypothetical protein ABZ930_16875 [Streptomyces sp. NPDC046716]|uniref:hypothetical protein n=1 Tax=Streptomyces sp. NPDC046716 TaxID=3157093 RepID=UPI0033DE2655